ncbi:MAG: branched-chain amino acid aminotransferase, partial [Anaerolineae bacterium]
TAIKSLNYLENVLAQQEAFGQGADEALLLNTSGRLAGGCSTNLFLVADGGITTPPIQEGALPGIIRQAILDVSPTCGIANKERPITLADIAQADEAFLTNGLIGVRPLVVFNGTPIGIGKPGPITLALQTACRSLG